MDISHGPSLLFLDEPTSGLDSTSAHSVIEKVHHIARLGSTVILTIHQPSSRIQLLLDHLIILARGQLMYQGSPKDVTLHLSRMGRKLPKGENSIEYLIDAIQEYDQSELGVEALAEFARTGMKPPLLSNEDVSISTIAPTPPLHHSSHHQKGGKRLHLQTSTHEPNEFDHSVGSPFNNTSRSWSASHSGVVQTLGFTPSRLRNDTSIQNPMSSSPGYYTFSSEILPGTPTPHSSDYTVNENDYLTPNVPQNTHLLGPKFANSLFSETWILMRRNFKNIRRTPELFLSRLMVLTVMGFMMATITLHFRPRNFPYSYRASSYTIAGLITYLPFLALQSGVYACIVWKALGLRGPFFYFLLVLYMSLLSTNLLSFVVFVSSVVPNYILGYAAVIAFTALFFLFCGYFLNSHDIPIYWRWMNKISTMTYSYEGLLMNQYQTSDPFGINPAGQIVNGTTILKSLGISTDESKKWENVLVMLGWAVL
ncbi:hypothetical protein POTOM_027802 [Populus tomentosa]|uniref:ABC-2 type transporter transmembrane domain-containing protein n=1 Tax=Populus tomentosa TaxID=118781 RepID=A0A8X7ZB97_POPTO|nr:hypothetical protein POTOM_027802 [Populus tomentosa]